MKTLGGTRACFVDQLRLVLIDRHRYSMAEATVSCQRHSKLIGTGFRTGKPAPEVAAQMARHDRAAASVPEPAARKQARPRRSL